MALTDGGGHERRRTRDATEVRMYLARVIGTVVASTKAEGLKGQKLLVVQPLDNAQNAKGDIHVAVDTAQAGEGDLVTCVGSREAALACTPTFVPVDAAIIGIVDAVDVDPTALGRSIDGATR